MTKGEAIANIEYARKWLGSESDFSDEALDMAIEAIEKQIPKKPKHINKNASFDGNWKKVCPACGRLLIERITTSEESYPRFYNHTPHCICGQAIDWSEPNTEKEA